MFIFNANLVNLFDICSLFHVFLRRYRIFFPNQCDMGNFFANFAAQNIQSS